MLIFLKKNKNPAPNFRFSNKNSAFNLRYYEAKCCSTNFFENSISAIFFTSVVYPEFNFCNIFERDPPETKLFSNVTRLNRIVQIVSPSRFNFLTIIVYSESSYYNIEVNRVLTFL